MNRMTLAAGSLPTEVDLDTNKTTDQGRTGTLDYIDPCQTTSESQDELPTPIPTELCSLFAELADSARLSAFRLSSKLQETVDRHDLRQEELVAAQRDVVRLHEAGTLPNPTEYWQRSALPRAAVLVDTSMAAVVDEGERLGASLDRFVLGLDEMHHPWSGSEPGRSATGTMTSQAIARLLQSVPSDAAIHTLGVWWQRKLRRTATMHALPALLKIGVDADAVIGRTEMALLDS